MFKNFVFKSVVVTKEGNKYESRDTFKTVSDAQMAGFAIVQQNGLKGAIVDVKAVVKVLEINGSSPSLFARISLN